MRPKGTVRLGTGNQCDGEGDVITVEADPIPYSLCPACLALILGRSSGIRHAIGERWRDMHRGRSERHVELERQPRVKLERVAEVGAVGEGSSTVRVGAGDGRVAVGVAV